MVRVTAAEEAPPAAERAHGTGRRALRRLGWALIAAGMIVLLYLVYSLLFTNRGTEAAQQDLLDGWEQQVGPLDEVPEARAGGRGDGEPGPEGDVPADVRPPAVEPGGAVAVIQFHRPGAEPPVRADPLFVVAGVGLADLSRGPGHYPESALPGEDGNFAVAGHRTTHGAPFLHLDQLRGGDEIIVTDRSGGRHVYRFAEQRIVEPTDLSVLAPDPLGRGRPTLTFTTCHPRFSARQRLIVFAELVA